MREQEATAPNSTTETTLLGISEILSSSSSSADVSNDSAELARILREHNVEYAQKVTRSLVCPVCDDPAKQPVSHRLCSQLFCRECLSQWIHRRTIVEKQPAECPHCRQTLLADSCESARHLERVLDDYALYCPHCRTSVLRGELMSHINSACPVTSMKRELEVVKEQLNKERADHERALDTEKRRYEAEYAVLQEALNKEAAELSRQKKEFRDALNASSIPIPTTTASATPSATQSQTPYAGGSMASSTTTAVVHLNVSGTKISVSRQLLLAYPHSLLARQLTGDLPEIYDEHRRLFVNANPILFRYIIAWLSTLRHAEQKTATCYSSKSFGIISDISDGNERLLLLDAIHLKLYHLVLKLLPFQTQWSLSPHDGISSFSYEDQDAIDEIVNEYVDRFRLSKLSKYKNYAHEMFTVPVAVRRFNDFSEVNWSDMVLKDEDLSECTLQRAVLQSANLRQCKMIKSDLRDADLKAAKLQFADLTEANLQNANLQRANLQQASLQTANLRNTNLQGANLQGANLRGADLRACQLKGADLRGAILDEANLSNADMQGSDLEGASLIGTILTKANLKSANLKRVNLDRCNLKEANLQQADLSGASLKEANLQQIQLSHANLSHSNLSQADLSHANLSHCNASDAILAETNLSQIQLEGIKLSNQQQVAALLTAGNLRLHRIDLSGIDFSTDGHSKAVIDLSDIDLSGADMRRCVLRAVNLQRAILREANLQESDLSDANLHKADLKKADLQGANLRGANLQRANLQGANLQQANLEEANLVDVNLQQLTSYDGVRLSQKEHVMQFIAAGNKQLRSVNLKGVDLSGCDLSGCDLSGCDLSGCDLSDCDLSDCDLSDSNLSGANLTKANLSGAVIRDSQLTSSILNEATIGDADFTGSTMSGAQVRNVDTGVADIRGLCFQSSNDTVVTQQSDNWTTYVIGTSSASKPLLVLSRKQKQKQSPIAELSRYRFDFRIENKHPLGLNMFIGLIPESTAAMGSNSLSDAFLSQPKLRGFGLYSNGYLHYYSKQRQKYTSVSYGGIGTNTNTYSIASKICPGTTIVSMVVNVCTGYLEYLIDDVSIGVAPIFADSNTDTEYRSSNDNGRESMQRYMDINGDSSSSDEGWVPCISLCGNGTRVRLMSDTLRCITTTTVL